MTERDPRIDPRPGDVIASYDWAFVNWVKAILPETGSVEFMTQGCEMFVVGLDAWRDRCAFFEVKVLKKGEST